MGSARRGEPALVLLAICLSACVPNPLRAPDTTERVTPYTEALQAPSGPVLPHLLRPPVDDRQLTTLERCQRWYASYLVDKADSRLKDEMREARFPWEPDGLAAMLYPWKASSAAEVPRFDSRIPPEPTYVLRSWDYRYRRSQVEAQTLSRSAPALSPSYNRAWVDERPLFARHTLQYPPGHGEALSQPRMAGPLTPR